MLTRSKIRISNNPQSSPPFASFVLLQLLVKFQTKYAINGIVLSSAYEAFPTSSILDLLFKAKSRSTCTLVELIARNDYCQRLGTLTLKMCKKLRKKRCQ